MSRGNDTIDSVQMMRGFAAILVALYHYSAAFSARGGQSPIAFIKNGGYGGVDIFFVISGFIMAFTSRRLKSGVAPTLVFFLKRLLRIFSGWIPVFLVLVAAYRLLAPNWLTGVNLVRSMALLPQPHSQNLLAITWSLSYEIYFYAMLSLLLVIFGQLTIFVVVSYGIMICLMRSSVEFMGLSSPILRYVEYSHAYPNIIFSAYTLEFLLGFMIFWLPRRVGIELAISMILLGVTIFSSGMLYIRFLQEGAYMEGCLLRALFFGLSTSLALSGLVALEKLNRIRVPKLFVYGGNMSYAIYLLHVPAYDAFFKVGPMIRSMFGISILDYPWATTLGAIVSLLMLSALYFMIIENPLHIRIRSMFRKLEVNTGGP